jgi:hypothetical protein
MTLKEWAVQDNLIMRALKVSEISHIVAKTNLGDLNFKLNYEGTENDYRFTLDAVPFEDKENKELIKLFEGSLYTKEETIVPLTPNDVIEIIANQLEKENLERLQKVPAALDLLNTQVSSKTASEIIIEDNTNGGTN